MAKLVVLAGLPGAGKSTLAREVARRTGAVWLRVDSMDQAIRASGSAPADLEDWTCRAAQAVASDNLLLGRDVLADCVNDWDDARTGWAAAAARSDAELVWVEVTCSDPDEHRRRVESRVSDVPGLALPNWKAVLARRYGPRAWDHATVDTAGKSVDASVAELLDMI